MAESLPTLSRPESEEAKPGTGRQMAPLPQEKDSMVSGGLDLQGICGWHELQRQGLDLEYSGSITN